MSVGLLIVSHGRLGAVLFDTVRGILGEVPLATEIIEIPPHCDPDEFARQALAAIGRVDSGDGVLVLTDMYGSTPSNIACQHGGDRVAVVAGMNLPMLIRVMNYPEATLPELTEKALSGGREGVILCRGRS